MTWFIMEKYLFYIPNGSSFGTIWVCTYNSTFWNVSTCNIDKGSCFAAPVVLFFFTYALLAVVYVSHVEDRFFNTPRV
jgi:hypothetical protein